MVSKSKYSTSTMIGVSIVGTPTPVFWDSHYAISVLEPFETTQL